MYCILSADENWGIGKDNKLLVSIPADMKMFREKTIGNVVIMGRKTLESFPKGLPLKDRVNIVLSSKGEESGNGEIIVRSVEEAVEEAKKYPDKKIFVIGGGSIYKQFLPYVDTAYVTKIDHAYDADTFFPNLDEDNEWELTEESDEQVCFDIVYTFRTYERKQK
ncbi:MAG: dihydrofolate reductase [Lachnospiraceae bacterium]|nr:dihydrofolate reductase [Lachnospiraceae bacterium]